MTKVCFYRDKNQNIVKFTMTGHAEYDSEKDIVCAALSAVTGLLLNGMESVVGIDFGYQVSDGDVFFVLPESLSDKERNDVNILLESFHTYLTVLETQYQDNISISELEV